MANQQQMPHASSCNNEETPYATVYNSKEKYDPEATTYRNLDFTDKKIRIGFIRKVYGILLVQLAITGGIILLFLKIEYVKDFIQTQLSLVLLISTIIMFVTLLTLVCCGEVGRRTPWNYILLFMFTIAMGVLLGIATSTSETQIVILAVAITGAICLGLTLFSFQTKWDFTLGGGWLLCFLIVFTMFGCFTPYYLLKHEQIIDLIYASIGVLLFSFYLIYDTQLIIGGKHKYAFSPENYIFAVLILYLDIILILINLLLLLRFVRFRH